MYKQNFQWNLVCENNYYGPLATTIYMSGVTLGAVSYTHLLVIYKSSLVSFDTIFYEKHVTCTFCKVFNKCDSISTQLFAYEAGY